MPPPFFVISDLKIYTGMEGKTDRYLFFFLVGKIIHTSQRFNMMSQFVENRILYLFDPFFFRSFLKILHKRSVIDKDSIPHYGVFYIFSHYQAVILFFLFFKDEYPSIQMSEEILWERSYYAVCDFTKLFQIH